MASFMPKPHVGSMANGCHHNLSLWRDQENVFVEPGRRELHLSRDGAPRAGRAARARAGDAGAARSDGELLRPLLGCRPVRPVDGQLGLRQPHVRGACQRQRPARVQAARRQRQPVPVAYRRSWRRSPTDSSAALDPGPPQSHSSYDQAVAADGAGRVDSPGSRGRSARRCLHWPPTEWCVTRCRRRSTTRSSPPRPTSGSASAARSPSGTARCTCRRSHDALDRDRRRPVLRHLRPVLLGLVRAGARRSRRQLVRPHQLRTGRAALRRGQRTAEGPAAAAGQLRMARPERDRAGAAVRMVVGDHAQQRGRGSPAPAQARRTPPSRAR